MTFASLFAGIGGFDLGLTRAGWRDTAQVEIDPACRTVLARHFPEARRHDDVTTADAATIGPVDLLCGGFPCQDLSVAGRRAGLAGARSGLFHEFMRLAAEITPRWVLIENVPGLLSSNGGGDMGVVLGTLGQLGYGWAYRSLDAQYFGLAQRRERVFIVGCLGDAARAAQVLFEPESGGGDSAPRRETRQSVAGTLGGGSGSRGWCPDTDRMTFVPAVAERGTALRSNPYRDHDSDHGGLIPISIHLTQDPISEYDFTPALGTTEGSMGVLAFDERVITSPGNRSRIRPGAPAPTLNGGGLASVAHSIAVRGREDGQEWELGEANVANALRGADSSASRGNWALTPQMAVRRLTPTECERLQGFPDGWTEGHSDSTRYRMLGNAVAVPCAEWIARRIIAAD